MNLTEAIVPPARSRDAAPPPRDTTEVGIFDLSLVSATPRGWAVALVLAALAWLGTVSFIGQYRPTQITDVLSAMAPLDVIAVGCTLLAGVVGLACVVARQRALAVLAAGVTGFLAGHWVFAAIPVHQVASMRIPFRSLADGAAFSLQRVAYLVGVGGSAWAAVVVAGRLLGCGTAFPFALGRWDVVTREFTRRGKPQSYVALLAGFAFFAAVLLATCQAAVGFGPMRGGAFVALLPAILLAAVVNATVEEILFRGILQPAFVGAAGVARGLWTVGLLFGLMHWGMSVGVIAALPTSLAIGVGSVIWGKSVLETRGLSWVIVCHTLCDIAIMSAFFLTRGSGWPS